MVAINPLVQIDHVHKMYIGGQRQVAALRGVSLEINAGDCIALMGPSGCGKSTLLHLIGGMDRPTHGHIIFADIPLDTLDADDLARFRRTRVGFVFQFFNLLPTLTVQENVMLPLRLDGTEERQAQPLATALLARVGLQDRATHFPAELSGGEMQRVAIARALVHRPDVVIADEPTGSLDTENGARVMQLFADLNRETGVTIVLATHAEETARYAKRVVRLRDGVIEQPHSHASL